MLQNLDKLVGDKISYTRPEGGLFVWCELPQGVDMQGFVKTLLAEKLAVVPGSAFMVDSLKPTQTFRMNFSTPTDAQLEIGVGILARVLDTVL
jgi:2-aminoadipate transaminase